jgi:hypothetical protein
MDQQFFPYVLFNIFGVICTNGEGTSVLRSSLCWGWWIYTTVFTNFHTNTSALGPVNSEAVTSVIILVQDITDFCRRLGWWFTMYDAVKAHVHVSLLQLWGEKQLMHILGPVPNALFPQRIKILSRVTPHQTLTSRLALSSSQVTCASSSAPYDVTGTQPSNYAESRVICELPSAQRIHVHFSFARVWYLQTWSGPIRAKPEHAACDTGALSSTARWWTGTSCVTHPPPLTCLRLFLGLLDVAAAGRRLQLPSVWFPGGAPLLNMLYHCITWVRI